MADTDRTFSENEMTAIVADRVERETADVVAQRDQLKTTNDELQNKLDIEQAAREAAEQKAAESEKEFTDFKAGLEAAAEQLAKKDERLQKVREAAAHLGDDFFTDERTERIVAMGDEVFAGYVADMSAVGAGAKSTTTTDAPRETAMTGEPSTGDKSASAAARWFGFNPSTVKEG